MIVAGVMSGTSADGIDVAFVRVGGRAGGRERLRHTGLKFLGHAHFDYPAEVRKSVLRFMNSENASVADLARLNFLLGDLYAEALLSAQKKLRLKPALVGCHGQTLYHQGKAAAFLGRQLAVTWQTGEASRIAARLGVPVVSDFRPADMTAGGKGAPLVPYLDFLVYGDRKIGRIALNVGGIANLTAIPAAPKLTDLIAFDTGPGNMVIDALVEDLFGKPYDHDGEVAASGRVLDDVIARFLRQDFFCCKPPKTAGREEFGREFALKFLAACRTSRPSKIAKRSAVVAREDVIATATALTVRSISKAIADFVRKRGKFSELIVSGGGIRNCTMMAWLADAVRPLGLYLRSSDEFGIPAEAKEAVAFAVLAFETWNRTPSNVPSATGAKRAAVLGKISYP